MTGNTSMMLGGFAFEALGFGYQGVKRRLQTPWVDVPVGQVLNQQQWTGPTSDEVTISGVLFPEEFGGQSQLDGIAAAAGAGVPMMLVSGSEAEGIIQGLFTVQSIDEDKSLHDARGSARRNAYTITLKRAADDVSSAASSSASRAIDALTSLFG